MSLLSVAQVKEMLGRRITTRCTSCGASSDSGTLACSHGTSTTVLSTPRGERTFSEDEVLSLTSAEESLLALVRAAWNGGLHMEMPPLWPHDEWRALLQRAMEEGRRGRYRVGTIPGDWMEGNAEVEYRGAPPAPAADTGDLRSVSLVRTVFLNSRRIANPREEDFSSGYADVRALDRVFVPTGTFDPVSGQPSYFAVPMHMAFIREWEVAWRATHPSPTGGEDSYGLIRGVVVGQIHPGADPWLRPPAPPPPPPTAAPPAAVITPTPGLSRPPSRVDVMPPSELGGCASLGGCLPGASVGCGPWLGALVIAFLFLRAGMWPLALLVFLSLALFGRGHARFGSHGCASGPALWSTSIGGLFTLWFGLGSTVWFWPGMLALSVVSPVAASLDRRWLWIFSMLALALGYQSAWLSDLGDPVRDVVERIREQSGRVDGVAVRVSLAWDSVDDLDLIVVTPTGERISWASPTSPDGGQLDVDMNVWALTASPRAVENIVWDSQPTAPGTYEIAVMTYTMRTAPQNPIPFTVEVAMGQEEPKRYTGFAATQVEQPVEHPAVVVARFQIEPGVTIQTPEGGGAPVPSVDPTTPPNPGSEPVRAVNPGGAP